MSNIVSISCTKTVSFFTGQYNCARAVYTAQKYIRLLLGYLPLIAELFSTNWHTYCTYIAFDCYGLFGEWQSLGFKYLVHGMSFWIPVCHFLALYLKCSKCWITQKERKSGNSTENSWKKWKLIPESKEMKILGGCSRMERKIVDVVFVK